MVRRGKEGHMLSKDWAPSPQVLSKLRAETGIDKRACGTDNKARTAALSSPRNLIANFAALHALCDANLTSDGKDVNRRLRGNFDAVTTVAEDGGNKVMTVTKSTPLLASEPDLEAEFQAMRGMPNTQRRDSALCHVSHLSIHLNIPNNQVHEELFSSTHVGVSVACIYCIGQYVAGNCIISPSFLGIS
jgi:hypothetical protein